MTNTLIRNGTLIDGTGNTPLSNAAVLVKENRIHAIGQANSISLPNESIHEIDAGGADTGVKQAVESGVVLGPRMQISISVLTITGGHGDGWMRSGNEFDLFPSYPGFPESRVDGAVSLQVKFSKIF